MESLEKIISAKIAPAMLERVVADQGVIGAAQRNAFFKQTGVSYPEIVAAVIEAYDTQKARLVYGVYRQIRDTDWKIAQVLIPHMEMEDVISGDIAPAMLERVVSDQGVIGAAQRNALFKQTGVSFPEIVEAVIDGYDTQKARLVYGLYQQISGTDWKTAQALMVYMPAGGANNFQASLVGRIPTIPLGELAKFLTEVTGQVCLIVSQKDTREVMCGTGFLVGPNMVLTCRHVLSEFGDDTDITANGNQVEVYFDFDIGPTVEAMSPNLPHARKVALDKQWRVESGDFTIPDGVLGDLDETDKKRIGKALDFILLRLAEPVGLQPIEPGGGRQRKWVDVSTATVQAVEEEDWIIIPQHPNGSAQRIDLGRYRMLDPTETRLRYDTNTAKGSSGAPCFNQKFRLVGLHNAYVGPVIRPLFNQAIRAALIAPLIQPHLTRILQANENGDKTGYVARWSVASGNEPPRVILGREKLLNWLQPSVAAAPKTLADRVYAAHADVSKAGCSFSLEILQAETRGTKTPRAVYGDAGQQLPVTVEDFLLSLTRELGIATPSKPIPNRPTPPNENPAATGIGEVDKLGRWISQELPEWLGDVVNAHVEKEIDVRPAAKQSVADLQAQGIDVPPKLQANADSPDPVLIHPNAWDWAYVAFDDLRTGNYVAAGPRTELRGEVRDLVAALVLPKSEATIHSGLRRLRWMFLGYVPDFVPTATGSGATIEILEPESVGVAEILTILKRITRASLEIKFQEGVAWPFVADLLVEWAATSPEPRLVSLQNRTNTAVRKLLARLEG